jgi:hypothetical protein
MITFDQPIDQDALRLRREFLEMPGLNLTVAQVARLLDLRLDRVAAMLEVLEDERFLVRSENGYRAADTLTQRPTSPHRMF